MNNVNRQSIITDRASNLMKLDSLPMSRRRMVITWCAITLLYLVGVTWCWWPTPDSALYLSLGRSIAEGNGYVFNGEVSNTVTPGLPAALAGIRMVFGDSILAANMFVALCGLVAVIMAYRVVCGLADRHIALGTAIGVGCSYTFYLSSHLVLTEAPTAMLVAMFIYCHVTRRSRPGWVTLCLLVLLSVACVLVRVPTLGLLFLAAIGMLLDRGAEPSFKRRVISAAVVILAVAAMAVGLYVIATTISQDTPLYVKTSTDSTYGGASVLGRLSRVLPGMFWLFPEALTEMFTGQSGGALTVIIGFPVLAMIFIGAWNQWRGGNRLVPVLAVLFPLGTSLLLGNWAIRPRYFMPIQFLLVFLCLDGLVIVAATIGRARRKVLTPQIARRTLEVFVIAIVAFNIPRVAKIGIGHGYWAVTGRFYEKVRRGDFVDIPAVEKFFAGRDSTNLVIATHADCLSILHYISGKKVVSFPSDTVEGKQSRGDAEVIVKFIDARGDINLVVLDWDGGTEEFRSHLRKLIEADANLESVRKMEQYDIYRRRK